MMYVYARRTDTDCFIVIEDEAGERAFSRHVAINGPSELRATPTLRADGSSFTAAGVYLMARRAENMEPCDEEGRPL